MKAKNLPLSKNRSLGPSTQTEAPTRKRYSLRYPTGMLVPYRRPVFSNSLLTMSHFSIPSAQRSNMLALITAATIFAVELGGIGVTYKHVLNFTCLENWPAWACAGASGTLVSLYCTIAALCLLAMLRPEPIKALLIEAGACRWPLLVNLAGLLIALAPLLFMSQGQGTARMVPAFVLWIVGMSLLLLGILWYIAPRARWRHYLQENWEALLPVMLFGFAAPWLATLIRPLWSISWIADMTFSAVTWLIQGLGYTVQANPDTKVIGTDGFAISVAPVCSGIEGVALVIIFVTIYLWLFREQLRFPRALLLYPLGVVASICFNILRITLLLMIGLEGNPELAVGGFHSHAGWLMFTLVAIGLIALAQSVPWLRRDNPAPARAEPSVSAFWKDPVVARILPFAVFMFSALAASTLSQTPGALYPLRVLLMCAAVAAFWPIYRALPWRLDPIALAVGGIIGAYWVLIPVDHTSEPPYGTLAGGMLVIWYVLRGVGTVLLVPLIEELFFRDYLERRLRLNEGFIWAVIAALVSAGFFAALHNRWAEAFVAGLMFSWLARRGRITDAVMAHAVANLIVFATALATGNLAMI